MLPLTGIKVIDLTRVVAGPTCTLQLGQMGAEVIKVEAPGKGDDTRTAPPFINGESAWFIEMNCNKKSITLDLKSPEGKEALWRLIDQADVFIENFRPGVCDKLGFSYKAAAARNPRLIYCSISGYGSAEKIGSYDPIIQGECGLMSITGEPEGEPMKVAIPISDLISALYGVQGILYALIHRGKTGRGQYVDIAMLHAMVSLLQLPGSKYVGIGEDSRRLGNKHPSWAPYRLFKSADGYVNIACGNNGLWLTLCDQLGLARLKEDPRFLTNKDRVANRDQLNAILEPVFQTKTTAEWCERLLKVGIPTGKIRTIAEIFNDPKLIANRMVVEVDHPKAGRIKVLGNPLMMSEATQEYRPAPLLGADNEEILAGLGFGADEIARMKEKGAI
ncbi:MAG: CaiB/BaiF CoA-transferase family protein [Syntrophales bacterium]|nr:CaiB/BaiF CoA-transferase family protein [Syntrophales bacterium]